MTDYFRKISVKEPSVKIPRWVFIVLLGIAAQIISQVYAAGKQSDRQVTIEQRLDRLESKFDSFVERFVKP